MLSKYCGDEVGLERVTARRVVLRGEDCLSFVYRYRTRDITKNLPLAEALTAVAALLPKAFRNAHLLTSAGEELQLSFSKKGKPALFVGKGPSHIGGAAEEHDREKKRYLDLDRPFLTDLGVTTVRHELIPALARKWKQINKFIEIFDHALAAAAVPAEQPVHVVDFGSGKGYLTFAVHDYLTHGLGRQAQVTGVELRRELVDLCNAAAARLQHPGLVFHCGDVRSYAPPRIDVMIALHACDIATDYALHLGIRSGAAVVMCSPCCHKEIRPQMQSPAVLRGMLDYGVHLGQEAEMLTDSLRALLLEACGYETKVFEFVSLEHTNKNKMILAVKRPQAVDAAPRLAQIAELKAFYGIREQTLERLLSADGRF